MLEIPHVVLYRQSIAKDKSAIEKTTTTLQKEERNELHGTLDREKKKRYGLGKISQCQVYFYFVRFFNQDLFFVIPRQLFSFLFI